MKIENNLKSVDIKARGTWIKPGMIETFDEHIFDTISIHSEIGSVEIVTEYCQRIIKCFGNLVAEEKNEMDETGFKIISVRSRGQADAANDDI